MTEMDYLMPVIRAAEKNNFADASDYVDEEGLLCCGGCRTRRQSKIPAPFATDNEDGTITVWIQCQCRQEKAKFLELKEQKQKEMEALAELRNQSLIKGRLLSATFENFVTTDKTSKYLKICKRYADNFDEMLKSNQGLLFHGDVGTGKTFAAACIANYLLDRHIPVIMTSFVKLVAAMQANMGFEESMISKLNKAKLLIIDDLGAERNSEYAAERVYDIIDSRYTSNLPIILTTNLSLDDMKKCEDEKKRKIYDRIFELCYPVHFAEVKWRKKDAFKRATSMKDFLEG